MSILIGIICPNDAIVLAADSQITDSRTGDFSFVDKISVIEFWPGEEVLVAQAGLWPLTNRVIQIMRKKVKEEGRKEEGNWVRITNAGTVTDILEDSIREAKKNLDKEQKAFIEQHPTGLMLAFYVGKKPHVYTIYTNGGGIATAADKHYSIMGVVDLAEYILREYAEPKAHSDLAIASVIFAIKKVKENNKFCGGDTKIRRLVPLPGFIDMEKQYMGKSEVISQDFVNLAENRILKMDERTRKSRDKKVFQILKKTGSELWQKHLKNFQAQQQLKQVEAKQKIGDSVKKHLLPALLKSAEKHRENKS